MVKKRQQNKTAYKKIQGVEKRGISTTIDEIKAKKKAEKTPFPLKKKIIPTNYRYFN